MDLIIQQVWQKMDINFTEPVGLRKKQQNGQDVCKHVIVLKPSLFTIYLGLSTTNLE